MKKLFLMLLAPILLIACNNDNGGENPPLPGSTQTHTIYADEIEKKDALSFTAPEAWTATVVDITSRSITQQEVQWFQLSAYSGAAGKQSISISLMPNFTGKSRKVEIKINSGETVITIIVEQKATTKDNKAPQYKTVKRMNSYYDGKEDGYIEFKYDNQQRVISWNSVEEGSKEEVGTITYSATQIVMTGDVNGNGTETYSVDSKGRVISRKAEKSTLPAAEYTYDAQGYLIKFPYTICSHYDSQQHQVYNRNVWVGANVKSINTETECTAYNHEVSNYEYTDKLNNGLASIDLTGGYNKGIQHIIFKEGTFGIKGKNLIKRETGNFTRDWSYEFDKDGNLTKFSIACKGRGESWTEAYEIIYN